MSSNRSQAPAVSVVVPAYQVSEWLADALNSIFSQTYSDFEVLVVDQDRDERMDRVLEPFRDRIHRLTLSPPGVSAARNLAVKSARGHIIAQLDGDDIWEPNALEILVGMLENDPSLDLVFPNAVLFGDAKTEGALFQQLFPARRPVTYEDVVTRRTIVFGAGAYRKAVFEQVGGFDESIAYGEDLDLWIRMLRAGARIDFTEKVLYRYRRRPDAACDQPEVERLEKVLRVFRKQLEQPGLTPSQKAAVEKVIRATIADQELIRAKHLLSVGDYAGARKALDLANHERPTVKLSVIAAVSRVAPSLVAALAKRRV